MTTPKSADPLIAKKPEDEMVIRDITPNITTLSVPFLRFGRMKIGGRGTIVKLKTGSLAVFSPVALTPAVKAKVQSLGTMKYIVATDFEHHIFLTPWSKAYPEAQVIGMEGLPEKREKDPDTKSIPFSHVFTQSNKRDLKISPEFDDEFDYEYFHSHANKELVFFHKPTRTVIEADLIFNLPATEQYSKSGMDATSGLFTKFFGSIMNTHGDMIWQRRFLWYAAGGQDRPAFADSARKIHQWDVERIIPCHGDVIETGGKRILDLATAWFRDGK